METEPNKTKLGVKAIRLLFRIISISFLAGLLMIALIRDFFWYLWMYLCHGGEWIQYRNKNYQQTLIGKLDKIIEKENPK